MWYPENEPEFSPEKDEIPNAAIVKYKDGSLHLIKIIVTEELVTAYEADLDDQVFTDVEDFNEITPYNILFANIDHEFEFDESSSMVELKLGKLVEFQDTGDHACDCGCHAELIFVEDVIKNNITGFIDLYIDVIEQMY